MTGGQFASEHAPLPVRVAQIVKRGYELQMVYPTAVATVCARMFGRVVRPIPHFVRN